MASKKFKRETAEDKVALEAVEVAEAAVADTEDGGDDATEAQAVVDTTAALAADIAETVVAAEELNIAEQNMISNDMARSILTSKGIDVKFEEPENVISNHKMEIVTPSETDVTPIGS